MKYVLFYTAGDREQVMAHFPAHRAHIDAFHARGELLMTGAFVDGSDGGAMGIFTTREAAEAFVRDDPFLQHGVVTAWQIRDWNEVLAGP
jgi:uncharacterized protein